MFQTKFVEKIKKKQILCSTTFFFENCTIYEIIWKNYIEPDRPQITISCVRIACWIPKATNAHS